ncbi:prepilin peptidase [Xanthobacter oligotrophicus]|uniref:prepilin peptidase n=1 Tax=Xanthobacter oligotrophicus TaxID=2607286 RepID=UPI0011F18296|nr:A24 family peptidase [Xanthobacter oligotrophicus]MCG5234878.1 A24 family peptidase [Xanthobacter oligotrophicus]
MSLSFPAMRSAGDRAGKAALAAVVAAAMAASLAVEPSIGGLLAAALVPVLAAIAIIDGRHFIIPDSLNALGALLGLAAAATAPEPLNGLLAAVLGGAGLALVFLTIRLGYRALRGRDGLGLGDVKLAAVAGIWLGVTAMAVAVEIAALTGLLAYGVSRLAAGSAVRVRDRLPFGLFFAPAIWIGWLFDRWSAGLM